MKEMKLAEVMEVLENVESCEGCPFAKMCHKEEFFWDCLVWEDAMGEDL